MNPARNLSIRLREVRTLRAALSNLVRSPTYTATALVSIAGAVALACSVYAVVAALLTPPPYVEAERLVELWQTATPESSQPQDYLQPIRIEEWVGRADLRTLEALAATGMGPTLVMRQPQGAERVRTAPVLGDWFGILGVPAARGRVLSPDDLRTGASPAAVVSHAFWRERMGSGELGMLTLSDVRYTVVGVMPAAFAPDQRVWLPVESLPEDLRPQAYAGIGRLRDGRSAREAAVEMQHLSATQVEADSAAFGGLGATVRAMGTQARTADRPALWILLGVVVVVLLVALNNLTVLTLVRTQRRSRALAVRAALGADQWELGRGLVAEGLVLGIVGALLGLAASLWGKEAAAAFLVTGAGTPTYPKLGSGSVFLALGLGILIPALISVEPLRRLGMMSLLDILQGRTGGATSTPGERRARRMLVAVEVAACVVLLGVATVLGVAHRSYRALDVGFDAERVVEVTPDWEVAEMEPAARWNLAERVVERLDAAPEVERATAWRQVGQDYPPTPKGDAVTDGATVELGRFDRLYRYYEVLPGFFETLGIHLVEGRRFTPEDREAAPVAIVTERGARVWWPGEDPLGRQVKLGTAGTWMTVVGVVEDVQQLDALGRSVATNGRPPMPLLFIPASQFETTPAGWRPFDCCDGVRVGARAVGPLGATTRTMRELFAAEAQDVPVLEAGSILELQMQGYGARSLAATGRLVEGGVLVALILAVMGIAGVVGESVARRHREIGIRISVGARPAQVIWTVSKESVLTALAGIAGGLITLVLIRGWLSRVAFGYTVQRLGPDIISMETLGPAGGLMALITAVGTLSVARRALGIDPMEALRAE